MPGRSKKRESAGVLGPEVVASVIEGLRVICEAVRETAVQRTEQERIRQQAEVDVARIHALRDVLLCYLDRTFDERRSNFDELFGLIDRAIAEDNAQAVARTLDAVVQLAGVSPFKDLADLARAKEALKERALDFEL